MPISLRYGTDTGQSAVNALAQHWIQSTFVVTARRVVPMSMEDTHLGRIILDMKQPQAYYHTVKRAPGRLTRKMRNFETRTFKLEMSRKR